MRVTVYDQLIDALRVCCVVTKMGPGGEVHTHGMSVIKCKFALLW